MIHSFSLTDWDGKITTTTHTRDGDLLAVLQIIRFELNIQISLFSVPRFLTTQLSPSKGVFRSFQRTKNPQCRFFLFDTMRSTEL